jgi:hypothetical protein
MATIADAVEAGILELYRLPHREYRLPIWPLWIATDFWTWHDAKTELFDPELLFGRRTISEHMDLLFCNLRCSKRPGSGGDLRRMLPHKTGVWSLHVPGARIYGWSPQVGSYVAVTGALASETKAPRAEGEKSIDNKKRDEVISFTRKHHLEHTIIFGDIHAIYPPK